MKSRVFLLCCLVAASLSAHAQTPKVTTVAGGYLGDGKAATSASFANPSSVAVDASGNIYVSDTGNCRIRRINAKGVIAGFAGTGICGFGGDGGPKQSAMLSAFTEIAFDPQGNLLIADQLNQRIRKITKSGTVTTIAGNGTAGYSGDGGPATSASLHYPRSVSGDLLGNVYIADGFNNVVRMVDTAGIIHTVAGNGTQGFSGDSGPATSAQLWDPEAVVADGNGNLYIADGGNQRVRKVDSSGTITTFAGNGSSGNTGSGGPATSASVGFMHGLHLGGNKLYLSTYQNIWAVDLTTQIINLVAGTNVGGFNGDGKSALTTLFASPWGMASDPAGDLLVVESGNARVRKIDSSQTVTTIAGGYIGDGGPARKASLNGWHIAFDPAGNLYIADAHRVRKVSSSGTITTFAGTGLTGYSGDGGPANAATLSPQAVAADDNGNIFIADSGNGAIRKVDSLGTITTIATGIFANAIAADKSGNVYTTDTSSDVIWKISPGSSPSIFAGKKYCYSFSGDNGPATQACLSFPVGLAVDSIGNVLISDWINERIRKVDTSGTISTVAGNGSCSYGGDGGPATAASFCGAWDIAVDSKGNLYVGDTYDARIRIVDALGTIATLAGTGNSGYNGNGLPATQTNVDPWGLAVDPKGVLYMFDINAEQVRKIH